MVVGGTLIAKGMLKSAIGTAVTANAHELGHAENNMNGTSVEYNREEARKPNGSIVEKIKGNENERKSINYENQVRQQEGHQARSYDYYKAYNVE